MLPRFHTPTEIEYETMFPTNPATDFYPVGGNQERKKEFEKLLRKAIKRGRGLSEAEIMAFYGQSTYQKFKADLEALGGAITWPSK